MKMITQRRATDPSTTPREGRHRQTHRVGLLVGAAATAALIAGCGGGSSGGAIARISTSRTVPRTANSGVKPPTRPSLLAFAKCMRAHGVANFPDPKPPGKPPTAPTAPTAQPAPSGGFTANPNSPGYQSASNDCRSLAVATRVGQTQQGHVIANELRLAVCMRTHGVPSYPDPTSTGEIGNNGAISGANQNSPAFQSAENACSKLLPPPPLPSGGPPTTS